MHFWGDIEAYRRWFAMRMEGMAEAVALEQVRKSTGRNMSDMRRAVLARGGSKEPLILTVPIEGGSSALKRLPPEEWKLSGHGRWHEMHLGALNASYGTAAAYAHIMPAIRAAYGNARPGTPFLYFTGALHRSLADFLDLEDFFNHWGEGKIAEESLETPRLRGAELRQRCAPGRPFMEAVMKFGREAWCMLLGIAALVVCMCSPVNAQATRISPDKGNAAKEVKAVKAVKADKADKAVKEVKAGSEVKDVPKLNVKAYEGFQRFVDEYGDTVRMTYIREIVVYPPMKFKNKKEEEFYWRTVRDVRKTLPYAKLCYTTLCETYEYIQTIPDKKKREAHLKRLEKDIFEEYKPVVKGMTKGQGKILLKLINRETDQSSYHIVKAFLGSFRAGFWQTFGRFFGMNMKAGFHPEKNREDAIIDRIATLIEQGAL